MLIVRLHALICVTFSIPIGVGGWLRRLLVALPVLSVYLFFEFLKLPTH